jgi:hypothetical protein
VSKQKPMRSIVEALPRLSPSGRPEVTRRSARRAGVREARVTWRRPQSGSPHEPARWGHVPVTRGGAPLRQVDARAQHPRGAPPQDLLTEPA